MPLLPAPPLEKGEKVGHISLVKAGEILMRTDLVVKESVAKGSLWQMFGKVLRGVFS